MRIAKTASHHSRSYTVESPNSGYYWGMNILAIGGGGAAKKKIYMYSPSTNSWIYVSDLPAPRSHTAVAVLSSTEILVIGGWDDSYCTIDTVYKGTLHL